MRHSHRLSIRLCIVLLILALGLVLITAAWLTARSAEDHLARSEALLRGLPNVSDKHARLEKIRDELAQTRSALEMLGTPLEFTESFASTASLAPVGGEEIAAYLHLLQAARHSLRAALVGVEAAIAITAPDNGQEHLDMTARALRWVNQHRAELNDSLYELHAANREFAVVQINALPPDRRARIEKYRPLVAQADAWSQQLGPLLDPALDALGFNGPRTFLILFQNNLELRPTGGFIGLYGIAEIDRGAISVPTIRDVYNFPSSPLGRLDYLPAPQALRDYLGPSILTFQDSNWSPDFPTTARVVADYYRREFGRAPDGVIAVNFAMMRRLLAALGPIEVSGINGPLTAENFYDQYQDERANKSAHKQTMAALGAALLEHSRRVEWAHAPALGAALLESLRQKEILLALSQPALQAFVHEMNWDGAIRATPGDYLFIDDANLVTEKISGDLQNRVAADVRIDSDSSVQTTLVITSTNQSDWASQRVYRRIYLPAAAQLDQLNVEIGTEAEVLAVLQAQWKDNHLVGQTLKDESHYTWSHLNLHVLQVTDPEREVDKTVIGIPLPIPENGGRAILRLTYHAMNLVRNAEGQREYRLLVQQQPGATPLRLFLRVALPAGTTLLTSAGLQWNGDVSHWQADVDFRQDQEFSLAFY